MIIWRADANGQIGRGEEEEGEKAINENVIRNIIGPYARAAKDAKGNGTYVLRICQKHKMIPLTTWKKPKMERKGSWGEYRHQENTTSEI